MTLEILLISDPLSELDPNRHTTLLLMREAQARGYKIYHLTAEELSLENSDVFGWCAPLEMRDDPEKFYARGTVIRRNLAEFDLVLLRKHPPFDEGYLLLTYMLDQLKGKVPVLNDPASMRNFPGKIFPLEFPEFIVPYSICRTREALDVFLEQHEDAVIKPVFDSGGRGIFRINKKDTNLSSILELYALQYKAQFIVQKFVPEAAKGDKRIILFDGEPEVAIMRVPAENQFRGNVSVGASVVPATLTDVEKKLCKKLGPRLRELGLFFAGLDMLGDYITEINVISVGAVLPANKLYNKKYESVFWDRMEKRLAKGTSSGVGGLWSKTKSALGRVLGR